jgi:hypothetical protein
MTPAIFAAPPPPPAQNPQAYAAAAARAELEQLQLKPVPKHIATAIGLEATAMPMLPKKSPHLYQCEAFVTVCKYDCEDIQTMVQAEDYWRRNAMERAQRIVIVRIQGTQRPWMFLSDVGRDPLPTPLSMRTNIINVDRKRLEPPAGLEPIGELFVLQGSEKDLEAYATNVEIKYLVGREGEDKYFEATGIPRADLPWQSKLLGVPLSLIRSTAAAPSRATVKTPLDGSRFVARFNKVGSLLRPEELGAHLQYAIVNGFDARVFSREPFTTDLKKKIQAHEFVRSVYTDLKTPPSPPKVGATATPAEVQLAARETLVGERPVFAHSSKPFSETAWQLLLRLGAFGGARLLLAAATVAVYALPGARADDVDGASVGDDIYLSSTFFNG